MDEFVTKDLQKSIGISVYLIKVFDYQHSFPWGKGRYGGNPTRDHEMSTNPDTSKMFRKFDSNCVMYILIRKKFRRTLIKHNLINHCVIPLYSLSQCNGAIMTACDGNCGVSDRVVT